jgi:hypothetical protein
MKILRRVLITLAITLALLFVGAYWVAPVALSFYAARKAPPVARVVPTELEDRSASEAPGAELSYFGYDFEVPWTDLDAAQTKLYPKDKPEKTRVDLYFHSGLRLILKALPPREWTSSSDPDIQCVARVVATVFGRDAMASDYNFVKAIYQFSPDRVHYWALPPGVHYGEQAVLVAKSVMLLKPADTGIFNLQTPSFKGFQQGDPRIRQNVLCLNLYSDEGSVEFMFDQRNYFGHSVTQPEINRIVQSLHKTAPKESNPPSVAQK